MENKMIFECNVGDPIQLARVRKLYSDMQSVLLIPKDPRSDHNGYDLIDVKSDVHLLVVNYIKELNGIAPTEDIEPWIRTVGEELKQFPNYTDWWGI